MLCSMLLNAQWNSLSLGKGYLISGCEYKGKMIAGSEAGLYQSADGASFSPHSEGFAGGTLQRIVNFRDTLYATVRLKGFFMSTDGGKTWKKQSSKIWNYDLYTEIFEVNGKIALAKSYDSIAFSADHGKTWVVRNFGFYVYNSPSGSDDKIYIRGNGPSGVGWYYSTDDAQTWNYLAGGILNKSTSHVYKFGGTWYALGSQIFSSTNGTNWTKLTDTIPDPFTAKSPFYPTYYTYDGTYIYGLKGGNIYTSFARWKTGMTTWEIPKSNNFPTNGNITGFFSKANFVMVSKLEGTYYSQNAGSNFSLCNMNEVTSLPVVHMNTYKNKLTAVWEKGIYSNTDSNTALLKNTFTTNKNYHAVLRIFENKSGIFTAFSYSSVTFTGKSVNGGKNYFCFNLGDYSFNKFVSINDTIHAIGYDSYGQSAGDYVLNDSGRIIKQIQGNGFQYYHQMMDLVQNNMGKFALTTRFEYNKTTSIVYIFNEQYKIWTLPKFPYNSNLFSAHCLEAFDGKLFMGTTNKGILISSDTAKTWAEFNSGIGKLIINDLTAHGDTLVAATDSGVFILKKGGSQWQNITGNLISSGVMQVEFTDHHIVARLENAGIWCLPLHGFVSSVSTYKKPENRFVLAPNPSENVVKIVTHLQGNQWEKATLYDATGRKVLEFKFNADGELNIAQLPAGLYYCDIFGSFGIEKHKLIKQ